MISSRKESNVKKAVVELQSEGLQVAGTVCHVGKAEDRKDLFEKTKTNFGGLDILVSNAAVNPVVGPVLDSTEEIWDKIFDINVKSTFLLMKESMSLLKCSKSPSIIIVSSIAGYQPFGLYESEEAHDAAMSRISMRRLGTSDEIGSVAAFLASSDASYMTGETIVVSGGMHARL
ncbi:dehydrogenase reductase sdr family member 4 [Lasius niger]|uniref:Dehydrogenase reductase sdr family member 4 n=1 Tax=Lasius niger TaxID=67767 RepID=A0A0J7K3J4_LASNI|nr:dehydrogenase reductase sdr family member 4 [Lasius niger]